MILSILNQIAVTDSTNAKIKIMESNRESLELMTSFMYAYNKKLTFGISAKTYPVVTTFSGEKSLHDAWVTLEREGYLN